MISLKTVQFLSAQHQEELTLTPWLFFCELMGQGGV
jgi:hypothetical protein